MKKLLVITLCLSSLFSCSTHKKKSQCELSSYAVALLDSTLKYYSTARIGLFHENYPSKDDDMVTYLAVRILFERIELLIYGQHLECFLL